MHLLEVPVKEERVQVAPEKDPPAPPSPHETVPVGGLLVPLPVSDTFAVKLIVFPETTLAGFGEIVVDEDRGLRDEKVAVSFNAAPMVTDAGFSLPV